MLRLLLGRKVVVGWLAVEADAEADVGKKERKLYHCKKCSLNNCFTSRNKSKPKDIFHSVQTFVEDGGGG